MNTGMMEKVLADTAYIRTGGSPEEDRCAKYLCDYLAGLGLKAEMDPFPVQMTSVELAQLEVDGREISCKGYHCCGSWNVTAPFYYLRSFDDYSLKQCTGKIVMIDGYLKYWVYQDLVNNGAAGFITYNGNIHFDDKDIDQRELRSYVHKGNRLPGVNIHVSDAVELIRLGAENAAITIRQEEYTGQSGNVVLDLPGERPEYIALTAHYDSTALSQGAYDNMSGCIGLLALAEYFASHPHRYGLRFLFCGSEERGLLGSKAYCEKPEIISNCVLNVNLDMIGSIMGQFIFCVTGEEKLVHYLSCFASEMGFGAKGWQGVYSSDSTPFADKGIPAVSFARSAPDNTAGYHSRYDTMKILKAEQLKKDIDFICEFVDRMANAVHCPVARTMPENMRQKIDEYLGRKRPAK